LAPSWTGEVARGREDGNPHSQGGSVYNAPDPKIQNQNLGYEVEFPVLVFWELVERKGDNYELVAEGVRQFITA
jgi:hypothetical protein